MCVGSVFTQPPYNDKNSPSVFYIYKSPKIFSPFSNRVDVTRTEAPPTIVDWQLYFSTDSTGVLPQTRPEWDLISCFTAGADVDKNDS